MEMELSRYVDELTIEALHRLLPNVEFELIFTPVSGLSEPAVSIKLPVPPGAEYSFSLWFRPEKQIHANLVDADPARPYFWYMPFEDAAFKNSVEQLDKAFVKKLELLVSHETRIVQKRGLLLHSFRCDYKASSGWNRVYRMAAMRLGHVKPPEIAGSQRIYHSPALAPRNG
jgi:hypothetical protein